MFYCVWYRSKHVLYNVSGESNYLQGKSLWCLNWENRPLTQPLSIYCKVLKQQVEMYWKFKKAFINKFSPRNSSTTLINCLRPRIFRIHPTVLNQLYSAGSALEKRPVIEDDVFGWLCLWWTFHALISQAVLEAFPAKQQPSLYSSRRGWALYRPHSSNDCR